MTLLEHKQHKGYYIRLTTSKGGRGGWELVPKAEDATPIHDVRKLEGLLQFHHCPYEQVKPTTHENSDH